MPYCYNFVDLRNMMLESSTYSRPPSRELHALLSSGTDPIDAASEAVPQGLTDTLTFDNSSGENDGQTCFQPRGCWDEDATCVRRPNALIDNEPIKSAVKRVALLARQLMQERDEWSLIEYVADEPYAQRSATEVECIGLQFTSKAHTKGVCVGTGSVQVLGNMSDRDVQTISRSASSWMMTVKHVGLSQGPPMEGVRDVCTGSRNVSNGTSNQHDEQRSGAGPIKIPPADLAAKPHAVKAESRNCIPNYEIRQVEIVIKTGCGDIPFEGNIEEFSRWIEHADKSV